MVVLQVYHYHLKICFRILKEEKAASKKELRQDRKKIFQFLKVDCLTERQLGFPSLSYLKIKISAVKIIQSKEVFPVPVMLIGWHIKNLVAMKIIVAADISVQD